MWRRIIFVPCEGIVLHKPRLTRGVKRRKKMNQKAKELGIEIISEDEFISRYGR